ncbi:hypothetical protein SARC_03768 [Sphaeroforma arctica JP610]|uniref:Uncharacterized protein n=1 Tax=Sphaeroforma arctica JP610 TaxID=667725 RepID=A0A0L0G4J7_9EUKA|nr:hypothetical protein SARC_03768 [Sphaeroforma arctica JP610]KNC84007.1 hypothetical protein SARC_03768 [Sphaeroforma arctica JP610]|eukprot:XP_014157909.1 hypothetical protein SARC_03768 [Sphaeroforma arctica JP610]
MGNKWYSLSIGSVNQDVKDSSPDEGSWISLLGPEKRETGAKLKCAVWWSADNAIEGAVAGVADIYDDREDVEPDAASRVAMKSVNFGSDATHHSSASANKAGTSRLAANTMSFTNDTSMTAVRSINTSNLDCIERNYSVVESLPVPKEVTVIDNRRDSESLDEGTPGTKSSASAQKADRCSITAMKSETSSVLDGQNMLRYTSSDGADIIGIAVNLNGHDYDADRGSLTAIRSININNLDDVNDEEYMQQYDGKEIPNMEGTKIGNNNEERRTNDSQSDIFSEARSQLATDEFEELQRVLRRFDENEKGKEQKSDMRETVVAAAVLKSKVKRLERENAKLVSRVSELEHEREVPA